MRLAWSDPRPLGPNEFYDVRLAPEGQTPVSIGWSSQTYYEIGHEDLAPGRYDWNIARIRFTGLTADGQKATQIVGTVSETRNLAWRSPSGKGSSSDRDPDKDGDGYPASVDCNDNDARIHPGAYDPKGDKLDRDCDGKD